MKLRYINESINNEKIEGKYRDLGGDDKYEVYEILDPEACEYFGMDRDSYYLRNGDNKLYYIIDESSDKAKYRIIVNPIIDVHVNQVIGDTYISKTNFQLYNMDDSECFHDLAEIPFELIPNLKFITSQNRVNNGLLIENNILIGADKSLENVNIPNNVISIRDKVFRDCSNLKSITIPNSIESIGECAFWGCNNLTCITIPSNVKSISKGAFNGCNKLKDIYYEGSEEDWKNIQISDYNDPLLNVMIHYNSKI